MDVTENRDTRNPINCEFRSKGKLSHTNFESVPTIIEATKKTVTI